MMTIDYINTHMAGFWIALGFLLLAIEVLILGFGTIVLLFAGLGAIITGLLIMAGVLPETWIAGVASFGITSGITSVLLWKPFKKMQEGHAPRAGQNSDLIGLAFVLEQDISRTQTGTHRYSGVTWKVELDASSTNETLASGTGVKVVSLDAGVFRVVRSN